VLEITHASAHTYILFNKCIAYNLMMINFLDKALLELTYSFCLVTN